MLEVTSQEYYEELLSEIRVDVGHGEWEENSSPRLPYALLPSVLFSAREHV